MGPPAPVIQKHAPQSSGAVVKDTPFISETVNMHTSETEATEELSDLKRRKWELDFLMTP